MNWKVKALAQRAISRLPAAHRLNHLLQRFVTGSLPRTDDLEAQVDRFRKQFDVLEEHWTKPIGRLTFFEFGAGPDLLKAILLYCQGANEQYVVDLNPLLRADLFNEVLDAIHEQGFGDRFPRSPPRRVPASSREEFCSVLRDEFGIDYEAPRDARATGREDASVDCIWTKSTLEHIPPDDLDEILAEAHRILAPGGRMAHLINYRDHYAITDPEIGPYNFLRYTPEEWARWNSSLQYQNRLRHPDYIERFEAAGFRIEKEVTIGGTKQDIEELRALPLAQPFRDRPLQDLAIRGAFVVASKRTRREGS